MDQQKFFNYIFARIQSDIENKRKIIIQEVFNEAIYVFFGDYMEENTNN